MHSFTFNGLNSRTYCKLFVSGSGTHSSPERDIESVSIPGRNGELTIDHGRFKNISVSYAGWILEDAPNNVVKARNWLCSTIGYKRLEDDYYPDYYRMARLVSGVKFSMTETDPAAGITEVTFDCMPQRWLKSGEIAIAVASSGTQITNPTLYSSCPLITVNGSGAGKIGIGGTSANPEYEIEILDIDGPLIIDCDIQRAYKIQNGMIAPKDNKIVVPKGYPVLPPGEFKVFFYDGVTSLSIVPRWWTV